MLKALTALINSFKEVIDLIYKETADVSDGDDNIDAKAKNLSKAKNLPKTKINKVFETEFLISEARTIFFYV